MNDDFDFDSFDEGDLYESLIESSPEDWLPDGGVHEQLDSETLALLRNF
jgi:hypothetical protein